MSQGIVFALTAAFLYGFLGVAYELAAKRDYPNLVFILWLQFWGTLVGLLLVLMRRVPFFSPPVLKISVLGISCYLIGLWAYLTASRERNIAANWTVLNLSVAVPILISILWFQDRFTLSKALGILFTLVAIVFVGELGLKKVGYTRRWLRLISLAFLLNGCSVTLFRFVPKGLAGLYILYFFGLSTLVLLACKFTKGQPAFYGKGIYWVSALAAITQCSGIVLTIAALEAVAKSSSQTGLIVFPITNGLPIPFGVVIGSFILRQTISRRAAWGVGLACAATILLTSG